MPDWTSTGPKTSSHSSAGGRRPAAKRFLLRWTSRDGSNRRPRAAMSCTISRREGSIPAMSPDDLAHDRNLTRAEALALVDCDLAPLLRAASRRRDAAHGSVVSYSRKVFIPLTQLCRDVCHYC